MANMQYGISTKEQEQKALDKIKKIVEELGENSYVGAAFEGCFEIAESNIENDWTCSMKDKVETTERENERLKIKTAGMASDIKERQKEIDILSKEICELREKVLTSNDTEYLISIIKKEAEEQREREERTAQEIVELADDPTTEDFQRAVRENREASKKYNDASRLMQEIAKQ